MLPETPPDKIRAISSPPSPKCIAKSRFLLLNIRLPKFLNNSVCDNPLKWTVIAFVAASEKVVKNALPSCAAISILRTPELKRAAATAVCTGTLASPVTSSQIRLKYSASFKAFLYSLSPLAAALLTSRATIFFFNASGFGPQVSIKPISLAILLTYWLMVINGSPLPNISLYFNHESPSLKCKTRLPVYLSASGIVFPWSEYLFSPRVLNVSYTSSRTRRKFAFDKGQPVSWSFILFRSSNGIVSSIHFSRPACWIKRASWLVGILQSSISPISPPPLTKRSRIFALTVFHSFAI